MYRLTVSDLREETKSFRIPFGRWTVKANSVSFYYCNADTAFEASFTASFEYPALIVGFQVASDPPVSGRAIASVQDLRRSVKAFTDTLNAHGLEF